MGMFRALLVIFWIAYSLELFGLAFFAVPATAQVQTDFDGDGVSDVTYTAVSGTSVLWKATGSHSLTEEINSSFGLLTDGLAIGHWFSSGSSNIGVIRPDSAKKNLVWKILSDDSTITQVNFGKPGDLVLSGGDFDGDGITDAAVVRIVKDKLVWSVERGIFSGSPARVRRFRLGGVGARAFFLNYDGTGDWLATFKKVSPKRARLVLRNIMTGRSKTINGIPKSFAVGTRPRPFGVAQSDGRDYICFVTSDETDTTVTVFDTNGEKVVTRTYAGLGTVFTGDFLAEEAGEEIAFQTGTKIFFFNPSTNAVATTTAVSGTPLDETNITQF